MTAHPHPYPTTRGARRGEAVLGAALYGVLGAVLGTVGTFEHRLQLTLGGATIWIGWFAGIAALVCVAVGLRLYFAERLPAYAFATGAVLAVVVLSGSLGPWQAQLVGQDVVIPAPLGGEWAWGTAWLFAVPVAVFLPALWPRAGRVSRQARTDEYAGAAVGAQRPGGSAASGPGHDPEGGRSIAR